MNRRSIGLKEAGALELAQCRIEAGKSAEAAMHGDFAPLSERAKAGVALGKPELDFIAALLAGELPFAKVVLNRKSLPNRDQEEFEQQVVNFVLWKMYGGMSKTEAVKEATVEFERLGKLKGDRAIWNYIAKYTDVFELAEAYKTDL